jgi:heme/copper-type cytochrome/quinol oxidase subunit 3
MKYVPVHDVAHLPTWGFGPRSPIWWGTFAFMLIEGLGFLMTIGAYFYLASQDALWPYDPPPELRWGTAMTALFLLSEIPNILTRRAARRFELGKMRIGLVVMSAIGLAAFAIRGFEFGVLNTRWDSNAYGSMVWILLGLHTTHIVTDVIETIVMTLHSFFGPVDARRFSDIEDNQNYWDFVIVAWLPIYFILYWFPRWIGHGS